MTRYAVMLGAGFSKWACNLPLVSELFDFQLEVGNAREKARLAKVQLAFETWRANNVGCGNEYFIAHAETIPGLQKLTRWYITRRLVDDYFGYGRQRYTYALNSRQVAERAGIKLIQRFFLRLRAAATRLSVLTTNYDCLVEYALTPKGFNYGVVGERIGSTSYPHIQPIFATGRVELIKLHGSLTWDSYGHKHASLTQAVQGDCLIVPPMATKAPRELLPDQWQKAEDALRLAQRLVIFGFAFNEYDRDILELFRTHARSVESIHWFDVTRSEMADKLFPNVPVRWCDTRAEDPCLVTY